MSLHTFNPYKYKIIDYSLETHRKLNEILKGSISIKLCLTDSGLCGLVPVEPPPGQRGENQGVLSASFFIIVPIYKFALQACESHEKDKHI